MSHCASCVDSPAPDLLSDSRQDSAQLLAERARSSSPTCTEAGEVSSEPLQGVFSMLCVVKERSGLAGGLVIATDC